MSSIKSIIVHCSASSFGNARLIDGWHRERGFDRIGYHYVVLNGYPSYNLFKKGRRWDFLDGTVECGRDLDDDPYLYSGEVGAHAYGFNRESVGVCLIGRRGDFTACQFYMLRVLLNELRSRFNLPLSALRGHYEINPHKTCPDIDMDQLRAYLEDYGKIAFLVNNHRGRL